MYAGLIMLGVVAAMVAPGFALKARSEDGYASVDGLMVALAAMGLVLIALAAVFGLVSAGHAGMCSALVWPGMRLPNPYRPEPNWDWTITSVEMMPNWGDDGVRECATIHWDGVDWEDPHTIGAVDSDTMRSALLRRSWQVESMRDAGAHQWRAPIGPEPRPASDPPSTMAGSLRASATPRPDLHAIDRFCDAELMAAVGSTVIRDRLYAAFPDVDQALLCERLAAAILANR